MRQEPASYLRNVSVRDRQVIRQSELESRWFAGRAIDIPDAAAIDRNVVVVVAVIVAGHRDVSILSPMDPAILPVAAVMEIPVAVGRTEYGDVVAIVTVIVG